MPKRNHALKLIIVLAVLIVSMMMFTAIVSAAPRIVLNGNEVDFPVKPTIVNDRTLVPIRGIFETLGAVITWDGETRTVVIERNGLVIKMTIDDPNVSLNGNPMTLDVAPQIIEDRTFVPLRFISESLGAEVLWDGGTQTVTVNYIDKKPGGGGGGGAAGPTKEQLKQQIAAKYQAEAQSLKNEILSSLNAIIDEAKNEYNSLPEEEKASSKLAIYSKYLGRAVSLQDDCDSRFNKIMSRMIDELQSNGLTQEPVETAKAQYEQEKTDMMKSLAEKAQM